MKQWYNYYSIGGWKNDLINLAGTKKFFSWYIIFMICVVLVLLPAVSLIKAFAGNSEAPAHRGEIQYMSAVLNPTPSIATAHAPPAIKPPIICALPTFDVIPVLYAFSCSYITPSDFISFIESEDETSAVFTTGPNMDLPGSQDIVIELSCLHGNVKNLESTLFIIELIREVHIEALANKNLHEMFDLLSFIPNYDQSYYITYTLPFWEHLEVGDYTITFNVGRFTTHTTLLVRDTTPPLISGMFDKKFNAGGTAAYRLGVIVTDNYDPNPSLTIDSSQVDLNRPGTYEVIYTAQDESGNISTAKGLVTVVGITQIYVNDLADGILEQIIHDDLTGREKAQEIFTWVANRMAYSSGNSPRDIVNAAYACFTRGSGDCYVYMAGAQVLLDRAGIENVTVKRLGGLTEHYWLLVNTGEGWYHFDVTPIQMVPLTRAQRFMFTDSQAAEYTRRAGGGRELYTYDKSLVPEVMP